jgi:hypothetical protein
MKPGKAWAILTAPINQSASQFLGIEITLITLDEASFMETAAALNSGFFFISIR